MQSQLDFHFELFEYFPSLPFFSSNEAKQLSLPLLFLWMQTASGKTHTVFGPEGWMKGFPRSNRVLLRDMPSDAGVAPRACAEILAACGLSNAVSGIHMEHTISSPARESHHHHHHRTAVTVQYVEVYRDTLTDLTTGHNVQLRDNGHGHFVPVGAAEIPILTVADLMAVLHEGERRKRVGCTRMNVRSSRAHTCLIFSITQTSPDRGSMLRSQLHIVDLAGSEQLHQSGSITGERKREAVGINSSLMVLRKCIAALIDPHTKHVPYNESKLSMLLKSAFGGNCKTVAIITASLADRDGDQTVQVRYNETLSLFFKKGRLI